MKCYCCGKPLSETDGIGGWHKTCVKRFFGTSKFPSLDISDEVLLELAKESTNKGFTIPGVQKKLSLHLTEERNPRLTLVNYPTGYILKPQTEEYRALPEAEYLVMQMARATGIKTVPFALLRMNEKFAYMTKRIDRPRVKKGVVGCLAMEDFCQLEGRLTADKYKGSYERCAKVIETYSDHAGLDMAELFLRVVFSYAVGNSDMHLKNFSMMETAEGSERYVLSDAYDMLPVNVILPADTEQMALTLNGKKRNLRKNDFLTFADTCGLVRASAEKMIGKIVAMEDTYLSMCRESYLPDDLKEALNDLIVNRIAMLI